MSISAGQMVQRRHSPDGAFLLFGLYNSIVRNSILVLVSRDYYDAELRGRFARAARRTLEARVEGHVLPFDNSRLQAFMRENDIHRHIAESVIRDLCRDVFVLRVDGSDSGVVIEGRPRYLDGDIWVAIENEGRERFVTTFLDVADPAERERELRRLVDEVHALPGESRVIAQYDDLQEFLAPDHGSLSGTRTLEDVLLRFGLKR
jgi:hypothetical protein